MSCLRTRIPSRPRWGVTVWYQSQGYREQGYALISVISIYSDSSEDSVGWTHTSDYHRTPIIAPTIPPSPDYTPASPDYSPASDTESDPSEDASQDHMPPSTATFTIFHRLMTPQTDNRIHHHTT
ncbi:hypothetical protein Tco_0326596 [Tanacetum coccineum]